MRARALMRRWVNRVRPRAVILLYHRVTAITLDPQLLCVTPRHFAEHLAVLQERYSPRRLEDLQGSLAPTDRISRSVAVTFDDGYADNLYQAMPLLEQYRVPATIFITTNTLETGHEFWWDELERIFLATDKLPERLYLRIDNQPFERDLTTVGSADPAPAAWHVLSEAQPSERQAIYLELAAILKGLVPEVRDAALEDLFAWAGLTRVARSTHRSLSPRELRELDSGNMVKAGVHGRTHSMLAALPLEAQRDDIIGGKQALEECLVRPVDTFSYPFGGRSDYTVDTVRLVREAGFSRACSNFSGLVYRDSDPYQLPRFIVRNWDGDEFARRLEDWLAN